MICQPSISRGPVLVGTLCLLAATFAPPVSAAPQRPVDKKESAKQPAKPFRWVNSLPKRKWPAGLQHATFQSPSMKTKVGYCIYLPPAYVTKENARKRFPVVYYLHGGRPGNETKSIHLTMEIDRAMRRGKVPDMIYVFVNGGKVSHYNTPQFDSLGEDVFVNELIPHVDATYRTVAKRAGRGLEGFSQGGRGTTRIMFRHPQRFGSCAPGGAGYATEKSISENNGRENDKLVFATGDNTWDLARKYARDPQPPLKILVHVGTEGFNYTNNLEYMQFLTSLKIPYDRLIVKGVPHSAKKIYQKSGLQLMQFHAKNFGLSVAPQR